MHCDEVQKLLEPYALGQLAPEERRPVDLHLAGCEDCRSSKARLESLVRLLRRETLPAPPEGMPERVLDRARQRLRPTVVEPWRPSLLRWWPAASVPLRAAAVLLLGLGLLAGGFMGRDVGVRGESHGDARRARAHAAAEYHLDCLSEAPSGSLAGAYLRLLGE